MTRPYRAFIWMSGFLVAIAALAVLIAPRLAQAFQANPFFNGVILFVLASGIVVNLRQVLVLSTQGLSHGEIAGRDCEQVRGNRLIHRETEIAVERMLAVGR